MQDEDVLGEIKDVFVQTRGNGIVKRGASDRSQCCLGEKKRFFFFFYIRLSLNWGYAREGIMSACERETERDSDTERRRGSIQVGLKVVCVVGMACVKL